MEARIDPRRAPKVKNDAAEEPGLRLTKSWEPLGLNQKVDRQEGGLTSTLPVSHEVCGKSWVIQMF